MKLSKQCSELLSGSGHRGNICFAHKKIPDSRRKACVQHKAYCVYKQFRFSAPFLSGNGKNPPEFQFPDVSQWTCLQQTCQRRAVSGHMSELFSSYFINIFLCFIEHINHNSFWSSCLLISVSGSPMDLPLLPILYSVSVFSHNMNMKFFIGAKHCTVIPWRCHRFSSRLLQSSE